MAEYHSIFTGEQIDERLTAVPGKYSKPEGGIPATDMDEDVQAALALAATSIQSLADYYDKEQVDAMLAAINAQEYVDVSTLPTASVSTMGKIYLVGPNGSGYYSYYISSYDGSAYSWVGPLGTTEISLAGYATKAELNQLDQKVGNVFSYEGKAKLMEILRAAVYSAPGIDDALDALEGIILNDPPLAITAVYTPSSDVYVGDSLDVLRPDLVVTVTLTSGETQNVLDYALVGELSSASNVITVSFAGLTTTFTAAAIVPVVVDTTKFKTYTYPNTNGVAYDSIPYTSSNVQRYSYPYFDILLSPGKYRFKLTHEGLTSGQYYQLAVTFYDETFRAAGVAGLTTDMSSHVSDYGWQAVTFNGDEGTLDLDISNYATGVGVRMNVSVVNSGGTAITTPTAFKITSCVITPNE